MQQNKVVPLDNQKHPGLRIPPHDLTVEQAILGIIIMYPESLFKVKHVITPSDFYRDAHCLIYETILSLKTIDYVSLHAELVKRDVLEQIGGDEYLVSLIDSVMTSAGIQHYAEILKDLSHKRQIITLCSNMTQLAFDQQTETQSILSDLKGGIRDIETDQPTEYIPNDVLLAKRLDVIESRSKGEQPGYLTGIQKLDDKIYGLWPSCTYVLMAKSQSGKSSLSLNIADNIAQAYPDKTVVYCILESNKEYVSDRRLTRATQIPLTRLQLGKIFGEYEWKELTEACNTLPQNIMLLDDPKLFTFEVFAAKVESLSLEHKISLVVLDYLQLMNTTQKIQSRHLQLSHIATQMNWLAKSIKAPVMYLSQVNKENETKESGDIYNAADVVMRLDREKEQEEAKLEGTKGRDIEVPFWVQLHFKRQTQTWGSP